MQHVKMLADVVDVARRAADRWYVTTGNNAVGPVNLDLLARGVEAGKVPLEAFVRHEEWKVWRPLSELAVILPDGAGDAHEPTDDIVEAGRVSTPTDFVPTDAIDGAANRREALVLLLTAAVVRGGADAAIVYEIDDEGVRAVCAHGPSTRPAIGLRTPRLDPAVVAAEKGATIVTDATAGHDGGSPGPVSASTLGRLARLGAPIEGALLIPIHVRDRLVGMIEIGRRTVFSPAEIASLEALVDALVVKLNGWAA